LLVFSARSFSKHKFAYPFFVSLLAHMLSLGLCMKRSFSASPGDSRELNTNKEQAPEQD
jgi:hypothetical protein